MSQLSISPLPPNIVNVMNSEPVRTAVERYASGSSNSEDFANILTEAFSTVKITDGIDKSRSIDLLTGAEDDLSGMLLDMQKAELSLQLALQIRNKLLDAYNEVMKMNV